LKKPHLWGIAEIIIMLFLQCKKTLKKYSFKSCARHELGIEK